MSSGPVVVLGLFYRGIDDLQLAKEFANSQLSVYLSTWSWRLEFHAVIDIPECAGHSWTQGRSATVFAGNNLYRSASLPPYTQLYSRL